MGTLLVVCLSVCLVQFPLSSSEHFSRSNLCSLTFEPSSTCGQFGPEEFTTLDLLASGDRQVCDSSVAELSHPPEALNDLENHEDESTFTWWQSVNGVEEVSLILTLGGFFFLDSVRISFKSPLPAAIVLEVSQDFRTSFHPLRYFSTDCERDFDLMDTPLSGERVTLDQLICTSDFTDGVVEGSQNLVIFNPSACDDCSDGINGFPTFSLTNLRIRLVRFSSSISELSNPLLSYHAIFDINPQVSCICSGRLSSPDAHNGTLLCPCSIPLELSSSCTPPTTGPLCRTCTPGFYRSALTGDICLPCNCDPVGSVNDDGTCDSVSGQCDCRPGVRGRQCDSCAPGFLGPTSFLVMACVRCFCNGFSQQCDVDEGWYQAQVLSEFDEEEDVEGFSSPGETQYSPEGYLEVTAKENSQILTLSFPLSYLGDKRTAFGQSLTFNLSFPGLTDAPTSSSLMLVKGFLEVVPVNTRLAPSERLVIEFNVSHTDQPQQAKITFSPGQFYLASYFSGLAPRKPAKGRDIRKTLANILYLQLSFLFPKEVQSPARVFRLHHSSLDFATNNITSSALFSPIPVDYVERCTCPDSREGSYCQSCSEHHTFDPSFGGEFARCVSCFCNFRSDLCDPVSGECVDCAENTRGKHCEICPEGSGRTLSFTFAPCDRCVMGFFDVGNGSCAPCNCSPDGSSSSGCSDVFGQCLCLPRVGGVKCDRCTEESSATFPFPSCERCDECTAQFVERIMALESVVEQAVALVLDINRNQTNDTQLPQLEDLFSLASIVRTILNESEVESLSTSVRTTHDLICNLTNRTGGLVVLAQKNDEFQISIRMATETLLTNLDFLAQNLSLFRSTIFNVSSLLSFFDLTSNPSLFLERSREALDRALTSDNLIRTNFSVALDEVREIFMTYLNLRETLTVQNAELISQLDTIRMTLDALEAFVEQVTVTVCGGVGRNGACTGDCGGVGCETCGAGEGCVGLARLASDSIRDANLAQNRVNELVQQIQSGISDLRRLQSDASLLLDGSEDVVNETSERTLEAAVLLVDMQLVLSRLEGELSKTRVDTDLIGRNVNTTLSLQLDLDLDQFFAVLVEINSTIEGFFQLSNVSDMELLRRANLAVQSAEEALRLITEVNASFNQSLAQYTVLVEDLDGAASQPSAITSLLANATESLDVAELALNNSRVNIDASRDVLSELRDRLDELEEGAQENRRNLERARTLTSGATNASLQIKSDAESAEEELARLDSDSKRRLEVSRNELEEVIVIKNRTCRLQEDVQEQLLTLENFIRIEKALIQEQGLIRADIERVANEIQLLDTSLQQHISRNTICLDTGSISRKRKRRRKRRNIT